MAEEKTSGPRPSRAPLLNLDTLTERYVVTVDGESYDLRNPGELSLVAYHKLGKRGEELNELLDVPEGELTAEQIKSLDRTLDELCRMVLDAPDEVHERLKDLHKLQVIQTFNELPESKLPALTAGAKVEQAPEPQTEENGTVTEVIEETAEKPTGESTSPD